MDILMKLFLIGVFGIVVYQIVEIIINFAEGNVEEIHQCPRCEHVHVGHAPDRCYGCGMPLV